MDSTNRIFIKLIKSALTGENLGPIAIDDFSKLFALAKRQNMIIPLFYGITNSKVDIDEEAAAKIRTLALKMLYVSNNQMFELDRICNALKKEGVDFLPLKGALLKKIYPKPEMRFMTDADIYIRMNQLEKISEIMNGLGYNYKYDSDHESVYSLNGKLVVEFHKHLIPTYNKDYAVYFENFWDKISKEPPYMSEEEHFIYVMTHLAKHYRDGGVGVKYITDIFVLLGAFPNMDMEYVDEQFSKIGILKFSKNIIKTMRVWFYDEQPDEITEIIEKRVFSGGDYGTALAQKISHMYKTEKDAQTPKDMRKSYFIHSLFPKLQSLKSYYPVLEKAPILLPVFWVVRIFRILFIRRSKKIGKFIDNYKNSTAEEIVKLKEELTLVGADFDF